MKKSRSEDLSSGVYKQIRDMILRLEFKPGERIPEEKLTHIVNGSRTIVRQALRKLQEDGLVKIYPRRFTEVTQFTDEEIKQLGVLRLSQDLVACQLAIRNGSDAEFSELKKLVEKCEESASSGNIYERIYYDLKFHRTIAKIGKNRFLIDNQNRLYMLIHLIQISKYTTVEDSMAQISDHHEIIDGLYKRDYETVKNQICKHLKEFFDIEDEIIAMY